MDLGDYERDNSKSVLVEGKIPEVALSQPCLLGIDEAGRGPVLGPMVYGTCFSPIAKQEELKELEFADSKTLTEQQRESIFKRMDAASHIIGWIVHVLSPNKISNSMLRRSKYNLNELSHDTAIGLIQRALDKGVKVQEVYVDTVGDPTKYQEKLKKLFPDLDITVAKKADAIYGIVGAASICAKVARDHAVKNWQFLEGSHYNDNTYGSGYPADPNTKKFMSEGLEPVFGYPSFVRFSWSTASNILDSKAVAVRWDDDDEDGKADTHGSHAITSFFQNKTEGPPKPHVFFSERCLTPAGLL